MAGVDEKQGGRRPVREYRTDRVAALSDGVFAIAATLLALDIRLPSTAVVSDAELARQLLALWPNFLGYVISFLAIGLLWVSHHHKLHIVTHIDRNFLNINLLFLMVVAFVPFPTTVLSRSGGMVATIFYAGTMCVAGLLSAALSFYAMSRGRLLKHTLDRRSARLEVVRSLGTPAVFLLSIGLAFFSPGIARISWVLIVVVMLALR